jgi:hypothetical protein
LGGFATEILLKLPNFIDEVETVASQLLDSAPVHKGSEGITDGAAGLFDGGGAE